MLTDFDDYEMFLEVIKYLHKFTTLKNVNCLLLSFHLEIKVLKVKISIYVEITLQYSRRAPETPQKIVFYDKLHGKVSDKKQTVRAMGKPRWLLGSFQLPGKPHFLIFIFLYTSQCIYAGFKLDKDTYDLTLLKGDILHYYQGLIKVTSRKCQVGKCFFSQRAPRGQKS